MNEQVTGLKIKRILVALDASDHSEMALVAAAEIAEQFQAELVGLFIEDVDLLHVAQYSFVKEVRFPLAELHQIDLPQMERYWQVQAAQALYLLRDVVRQKALNHSFEVYRGAVTAKLLAAALDTDLLVLGRLGQSLAPVSQLGSTARTAVIQAHTPVLLMPNFIDLDSSVLLLYDGTAVAQRALLVAKRLAVRNGRLRVLILTDDNETAEQYRGDIQSQTDDKELEVSFRRLHAQDMEHLAEVINNSETGILVIGHSDSLISSATWQEMLEQLDHPVLIIR